MGKRLETKVLERKLWAFLNIKLMRVLKQVATMTQKMKRVVHEKRIEHLSYGFECIKFKAIKLAQKKKKTKDSGSQTKIDS